MQTETEKANIASRLWKRLGAALERRPVIFTTVLALVLTLVLEMLGRHNLAGGLVFLFVHPVRFLVNMCIVLTSLSVALLLKKRAFFLSLLSVLWLSLGITNAVILGFRTTPLGVIDFALLPDLVAIIHVYMDPWQIVLLALAIAAAIAALVFIYIKSPRCQPAYKRAAAFVLAAALLAAGLYSATVVGKREERRETFSNLPEAYRQYGFVYCLGTGAFDRGIDEPEVYSQRIVDRLLAELTPAGKPRVTPDIILVQLESFFDVDHLSDVEVEEDPIPVFRSLKANYSSGFLTVPSVGAGTANTEFEVLSGMSLDFFGMGEYPYKTILREQGCETLATDLKDLGYAAHAIHNNTGTFYDRNNVFAQLGFDTYTSIEFMEDVEYNPIGWAKDRVLTGEVMKALDSSDDPHFVFAITVQGHGKYQRGVDSEEAEDLDVVWATDPEDEDAFAYYMSQLRETDEFIGELIAALKERGKPAVLVLSGDHLPNFDIGSEQLENGDIFQTEYVIWDNLGLPKRDGDLSAYQLSARVLGDLGIGNGILTRYHQQMADRVDYQVGLQLLEYDMLYGAFYCYGGENPYFASELRMGVEPVAITDVQWADGVLTVTGRGFTAWSQVTIDGDDRDTSLVEDGTLAVELPERPPSGAVITVQQTAANSAILAESGVYIFA